ncbi:hypothetical protein E0494_11085, partial [Marinilabiliaceae bacterium JC040]|nr:hypothetical protein [Marinilabiliaceae bacterium JC040]
MKLIIHPLFRRILAITLISTICFQLNAQNQKHKDFEYTIKNGKKTLTKYIGNNYNINLKKDAFWNDLYEIGEDAFNGNKDIKFV